MKKRIFATLLALLASATVDAALPSGISGPWYNSAQSGHGLSIELIEGGDRAIVIWNVYTPGGEPLNLYIEAGIDGRRMEGLAYAPRGMRFGRFDPAELALPSWGRVWLDFSSCDRATLNWSSTDANYGSGSMPLERLALLEDADCNLPPPNALPTGLVSGEVTGVQDTSEVAIAEGFLDKEGRLWGLLKRHKVDGRPFQIPGPTWVGLFPTQVLRIEPTVASAHTVTATTTAFYAYAFWLPDNHSDDRGVGQWTLTPALRGEFGATRYAIGASSWSSDSVLRASLLAPVTLADAAGTYQFSLRGQFFEFQTTLEVGVDGNLCVVSPDSPGGCWMSGKLSDHEGDVGLLSFRLKDQVKDVATYQGRAWITQGSAGRELVMVGHNDLTGLAIVATPR